MKKFTVKFVREFEVEIHAESTSVASALAGKIIGQFPKDTCRLLSVIAEDAAEGACVECKENGPIDDDPSKPRRGGPPNLGGSPQTPALPVNVPLVDQIAAAA